VTQKLDDLIDNLFLDSTNMESKGSTIWCVSCGILDAIIFLNWMELFLNI